MIFLQFAAVAICVIIVSVAVSSKAEWFEENTKIKGIIVGIILAASTSLPELVSGITAIYIGQPEMAASSILGSNHFNFLIISFAALTFIKYKPNKYVSKKTNVLNLIFIGIYGIFIADLFYNKSTGGHLNFITPRLSIATIIIVVVYFAVMMYFNSGDDEVVQKEYASKEIVVKQLSITLCLVALLVYMSIQLAESADAIVKQTGLSPSSVGAVLVGASTSLPEFVSAFSLVKNKKYDMAFSATLGSNLFNFLILSVLDMVYKYNITTQFTANTEVLVYMGLLNAIVFYVMLKLKTENIIIMAIPFVFSILSYVVYLNVFFL